MSGGRFRLFFFGAITAAGLSGLLLFLLPDTSPILSRQVQAHLTTPGNASIDALRERAKPCGMVRPNKLRPLPEESFASVSTIESKLPPFRDVFIEARDLPGIVKLEPETDTLPDQVAKGHCAATRIADSWFITAAHCVSERYDRINLKVGSEQLSSELIRTVPVEYAICHSQFGRGDAPFENDIALLRVADRDLADISSVPIVPWGVTNAPFSTIRYGKARVGGWGMLKYGGRLADHLQKMELDIFSIDSHFIRLESSLGRGPCIGDSGGPLVIDDAGKPVLMGVLSTIATNRDGEMCTGDYISTYINLAGYRDWADQMIMACAADNKTCLIEDAG